MHNPNRVRLDHIHRYTETERRRDTERQRHRETERQRDRETETERQRQKAFNEKKPADQI